MCVPDLNKIKSLWFQCSARLTNQVLNLFEVLFLSGVIFELFAYSNPKIKSTNKTSQKASKKKVKHC